jgi:hypothetical protein
MSSAQTLSGCVWGGSTGKGVEGKVSYFFAASVQERDEWVEAISWCAVNSNLDNGYIIEKVCPTSPHINRP